MLIYAMESCKLLMAVFFPSVHNSTVVVNGRFNSGATPISLDHESIFLHLIIFFPPLLSHLCTHIIQDQSLSFHGLYACIWLFLLWTNLN